MLNGFKKFILRGNVVDLAVAVVIGAAFGTVVTSLVRDIITPILGVFGGIPDFSAWSFTINSSTFGIGSFINAVLSFIVIAAVVYFLVVLPMNHLMQRFNRGKESPDPSTRKCPFCVSEIPLAATRCSFCTQEVPAVAPLETPAARAG